MSVRACSMLCVALFFLSGPPSLRAQPADADAYDRALALRGEAQALLAAGQRDRALQKTNEALALMRTLLGDQHPELQAAMYEQGVLYMAGYPPQEQLDEALSLFGRASEIGLQRTKAAAREYLKALQGRANVLRMSGRTDAAQAELLSILDLQRILYKSGSIEVATTLLDLAKEYQSQGAVELAERYIRRSLDIAQKRVANLDTTLDSARKPRDMRDDDIIYHKALISLGLVQYQREDYGEAEKTLLQAVRWGEEHRVHDRILVEPHIFLGAAAARQGNRPAARSHYVKALEYAQKDSLLSRDALVMSGRYLDIGEYAKAASLLLREQQIQKDTHRSESSLLASVSYSLAVATAQQGQLSAAKKHLHTLLNLTENHIRQQRFALVESRLLPLFNYIRDRDEAYTYTLLLDNLSDDGLRRLALSTALLRKARVIDELANASPRLFLSGDSAPDPDIDALFLRLRRLRGRYAYYTDAARATDASTPKLDEQLRALAKEMDQLERDLLKRSPIYAGRQIPAPDEILGRVAEALPKDAVLIEFLAVRTKRWGADGPGQSEDRYLALGLRPDGRVEAWDLGAAKPIDDAAAALVENASQKRPQAAVDERQTQILTQRLMRPLSAFVQGQKTLIISPDGLLNQVPFAALYVQDGVRLLTRHRLRYVNSGRDLLAARAPARRSGEFLIFARPDFQAPIQQHSFRSGGRGGWPLAADIWADLSGTGTEQKDLVRLFPFARSFLGAAASEANLLNVQAPAVLHIATHGKYIAPGREAAAVAPDPEADLSQLTAGLAPPSPLLRSALILAGAGRRRQGAAADEPDRVAQTDGHDGVVTALEASGMDLRGTQLVVLSACDSGRGDAVRGQGVLGLRRAFLLAGAESVVATLWPVNDWSTAFFMRHFYAQLQAGAARSDALQYAMQRMIETEGKAEPHLWSPFVLIGQDGPIQLQPTASPPPAPRP